jgi:hypothetical protein
MVECLMSPDAAGTILGTYVTAFCLGVVAGICVNEYILTRGRK